MHQMQDIILSFWRFLIGLIRAQLPEFSLPRGFGIAGMTRASCLILLILFTSCSVPVTGSIEQPPGGYLFNGSIHEGLWGDSLELNDYMYSNIGSARVACWGPFRAPKSGNKFELPLKCSDGRHGTATVTIDHKSHVVGSASYVTVDTSSRYSGFGTFKLNDNAYGWFWFGETEISACGCGSGLAAGSEQDLVANFGDRVFFASGSARLSVDAQQTLARQVAWLSKYPAIDIEIRGFTDPQGPIAYNVRLANKRADVVKTFLIMRGVATSRLTLIASHTRSILVQGADDSAFAQDRAAVVSVMIHQSTK